LQPKCGVLPISPFIASQHRADEQRHIVAKSVYCRFAMHQLTKLAGQMPATVSQYCPLDLCSAEPTRVKTALRDLLQSPQNNIRVAIRAGTSIQVCFSVHHIDVSRCTSLIKLACCLTLILCQNIDLADPRACEVFDAHFAHHSTHQPISLPIAIALVEAWCCHPALGARAFASLRSLQRLDAWDIEVVALLPQLIARARERDGATLSDPVSYPELVRGLFSF
jgi:hypothetical protein